VEIRTHPEGKEQAVTGRKCGDPVLYLVNQFNREGEKMKPSVWAEDEAGPYQVVKV
jgi:hypothetical protein